MGKILRNFKLFWNPSSEIFLPHIWRKRCINFFEAVFKSIKVLRSRSQFLDSLKTTHKLNPCQFEHFYIHSVGLFSICAKIQVNWGFFLFMGPVNVWRNWEQMGANAIYGMSYAPNVSQKNYQSGVMTSSLAFEGKQKNCQKNVRVWHQLWKCTKLDHSFGLFLLKNTKQVNLSDDFTLYRHFESLLSTGFDTGVKFSQIFQKKI